MRIVKSVARVLGEIRKELITALRRPLSLFGLVAGPFIVMGLFGLGFIGSARPLTAILVLPVESTLPREPLYYEGLARGGLDILDVTPSLDEAMERLHAGEPDLVVIPPVDPEARFLADERSIIEVRYRQVDPQLAAYAELVAVRLAEQVNREVIRLLVAEGYEYVIELEGEDAVQVSPEVVSEPVGVVTRNVAPTQPGVVRFFGPAVLALIVQHLALMLGALSVVGERQRGFMELLRLSPGTITEFVLGKLIAFVLMTTIIAALLSWTLVDLIGVPLRGDPLIFAGTVMALILASTAAGLFIGALADSALQAVHLALLALLVSVFFGGFVVPVTAFRDFIRVAAEALPARNAAVTLQDVMLFDDPAADWRLAALLGAALILLAGTVLMLRRQERAL